MNITTMLITVEGLKKLQQEISHYKNEVRPKIIAEVNVGREHGDLKENAEYDSACADRDTVDHKLAMLQDIYSKAVVFDPESIQDTHKVHFASKVTLRNLQSKAAEEFCIVSEYEANIPAGLLSLKSPLGSILLGKKVGDTFTLQAPSGPREYEIINIAH